MIFSLFRYIYTHIAVFMVNQIRRLWVNFSAKLSCLIIFTLHKRHISVIVCLEFVSNLPNSTRRYYFTNSFAKIVVYPKRILLITSEAVGTIKTLQN